MTSLISTRAIAALAVLFAGSDMWGAKSIPHNDRRWNEWSEGCWMIVASFFAHSCEWRLLWDCFVRICVGVTMEDPLPYQWLRMISDAFAFDSSYLLWISSKVPLRHKGMDFLFSSHLYFRIMVFAFWPLIFYTYVNAEYAFEPYHLATCIFDERGSTLWSIHIIHEGELACQNPNLALSLFWHPCLRFLGPLRICGTFSFWIKKTTTSKRTETAHSFVKKKTVEFIISLLLL